MSLILRKERPEVPETDLGPIKVGVQVKPDELRQLKALNERFMEETGAEVEILPWKRVKHAKSRFCSRCPLVKDLILY